MDTSRPLTVPRTQDQRFPDVAPLGRPRPMATGEVLCASIRGQRRRYITYGFRLANLAAQYAYQTDRRTAILMAKPVARASSVRRSSFLVYQSTGRCAINREFLCSVSLPDVTKELTDNASNAE
jgi:hypothetical protein